MDNATESEIKHYGTLVHGDVKDANILFNQSFNNGRSKGKPSDSGHLRCALYDFQYVGLGLPSHDLVYFLGTSADRILLSPANEKNLLEIYHAAFLDTIRVVHPHESREFPFERFLRHWELSIVDWYRFMAGWGFWGNASWVERRAKEIVAGWEADPDSWVF